MATTNKSAHDRLAAIALIALAATGYGVYAGGDALTSKFEALPVKGGDRKIEPATDVNELAALYPVIAQSERVQRQLEAPAVESAFRLPPPTPEEPEKPVEPENPQAEKAGGAEAGPGGGEGDSPTPAVQPKLLTLLPDILWVEAITDDGAFLMGRFWQQGEQVEIPGLPFSPRLARVSREGVTLAHDGETVKLEWRGQ